MALTESRRDETLDGKISLAGRGVGWGWGLACVDCSLWLMTLSQLMNFIYNSPNRYLYIIMKKLKLREIKYITQDHIAIKSEKRVEPKIT